MSQMIFLTERNSCFISRVCTIYGDSLSYHIIKKVVLDSFLLNSILNTESIQLEFYLCFFRATVVKSFATFWTGIRSENINIEPAFQSQPQPQEQLNQGEEERCFVFCQPGTVLIRGLEMGTANGVQRSHLYPGGLGGANLTSAQITRSFQNSILALILKIHL